VAFVTQPIFDPTRTLAKTAREADNEVDPDLEFIERWRAGDARAFEELVRRHERRVFGLLVRMLGSRAEAEDAAQDAFLNLHRNGQRFRGESRFSTFLYRVAVNAALNRRRSAVRRRAHMEQLEGRQQAGDDLPGRPRGPEDASAGKEIQRRVQAGIAELPAALRGPLVLYDIQGQAYADIARILDIAEGTVKSRIHRARQALRESLADLVQETEEAG